MARTLGQIVAEVGVSDAEIRVWIEQHWLLPDRRNEDIVFDEADVARARLIQELRRDLLLNDEAIPVVLSLIDQIHALRRACARVDAAVARASDDAKAELARLLQD